MLSNPILQLLFKILIFIVIIYTLQCGFEYMKNTYSKPKVKDLVNTQIKKYKEIVAEMNTKKEISFEEDNNENTNQDGIFNDKINIDDMNNELLSFMNSQTQQYATEP